MLSTKALCFFYVMPVEMRVQSGIPLDQKRKSRTRYKDSNKHRLEHIFVPNCNTTTSPAGKSSILSLDLLREINKNKKMFQKELL